MATVTTEKTGGVYRPGADRRDKPNSDWIPTTCHMCLVRCGVLVKVENGVVVNIIGNPESPRNRGRMCAKGKSGIMNHYNMNRVLHPLKRTNPEKGLDVDPKWQEISWDEAIETVAVRLRKIYNEDPRKLYIQSWGGDELGHWLWAFKTAFGTDSIMGGLSSTCGKVIHPVQYAIGGGFQQEPDYNYCNYQINIGTQMGVATREGFNHQVPDCAKARERGMKLVAVDPIGNNGAAKAHEWLPIRPGTDAAFALGMLNQLLNELKIYDVDFLKHRTNAGYLIEVSGKYVRDAETEKPFLYDLSDGKIKHYDDPTLKDPAIEGEYEVQGQKARPTFELLRARAAEYPPERVEEITTIPANTLKRIAKEYGEAAQVGATVTIDGAEIPYRPVDVEWMRGLQGHKHAWHQCWAAELVLLVVGGLNVAGSGHSTDSAVNYPKRRWPAAGKDGMLEFTGGVNDGSLFAGRKHHPGRDVRKPERLDLYELHPIANHTKHVVPMVMKEPEKYGLDHRTEMVLHSPGNEITGGFGDTEQVEAWYRTIDFKAGFAIELNEAHQYDDIVLPMPTYLEQDRFATETGFGRDATSGTDTGFHQIQQKVIDPPEGVWDPTDVMTELCARAGVLADVYRTLNRSLELRQPYLLDSSDPDTRYTAEELFDRAAKSKYGEEHGWDYFKEHGVLTWHRDMDERYPGPFTEARVPIYMEHFVERGEELQAVLDEMGIDWDLADYEGVPDWRPCEAYNRLRQGEIDAIGVHYKLPFVYGAAGQANPWIDELCDKLPHAYGVMINPKLAERKGIKDGDDIWLESPVRKVKAVARVTHMVHPDVLGIAGHAGHWAAEKDPSKGKGVNFNGLLVYDESHMDRASTALDHCAEINVYKA